MDKFINKENIFIVACVLFTLVQSNYFATKLDVANLKLELMEYSNSTNAKTEDKIDKKLEEINHKIDKYFGVTHGN